MVCELLKKCGQIITPNCGGHIHIGADYLKSKESYLNFLEIWGNCEKIIYLMSNEKGQIPRGGIENYATPISPKFNEAIENGTINLENEEQLDEFVDDLQILQDSRNYGLNLLNIINLGNTIEFRVPNGSINPDSWTENTRLFGRIIQMSQKLAEIENSPEIGVEELNLLNFMNKIKDENISEQEKMEVLLKLLFSTEEQEVYRDKYFTNARILEQLPEDKNPFIDLQFKNVDFKRKKHTKNEMKQIAMNERLENVNAVTYETSNGIKTEDQIKNSNNRNIEE